MILGRLDQHVRIEAPANRAGAMGEPLLDWETLGWEWAAIDVLSGAELTRAMAIEARSTMSVRMHYLPGLTARCRIVWGNRVLHIGAIRDLRSRGREHVLDVYEVEGETP